MDKTSTILIRTVIGLLMTVYLTVWAYGFYFFYKESFWSEESCATANGFTLLILFGLSLVYFIVSLVLFLLTTGQMRQDFKITLGLVLLPITVGILGMGFKMVQGLFALF